MKKLTEKQLKARKKLLKIRRYIDFDYDLRKQLAPAQIRKINRYHKAITAHLNKNDYIYRPRKKKNLKAALKFTQNSELKDLAVAFVPKTEGFNPRVRVNKKGKITARSTGVTRIFHPLNITTNDDLDDDFIIQAVQAVLNKIPSSKFNNLKLAVGNFELKRTTNKAGIIREVEDLLAQYRAQEFLEGVIEFKFSKQADYDTYVRLKNKSKFKLKKKVPTKHGNKRNHSRRL